MRRFRDQGFLMVAARPPAELASAAQAAGGNRRSMQGSTSDPLPAPLLQSPPGLANLPAPPDPAEITEFRITPEGQVFAKTLTPTEMATYRAQRGRSSAAGDSSRGAAPDVLPPMGPMSGRRRLPEKYSTDVNDVHVDDESHEAEGAEAEQKDRHEESAVNAKTSGLQKRRRLSYVIPIRDDRLEETADVYPGRASGRFNYRNPADGLFYFCSGTLISNNAVLLAAHCVVDVTRSPVLWMDSYSFIPGARSGGVAPVGTAYVKFVTYTSLYTNTTPGNDLAVAILSTQPGDLIGWQGYGYDCLPTSYQVNTTGYPSDKAPGTRWRANCTTPAANPCNLSPTAGLAFIDCDTMAGQSGSPIFSNNPLSGPMTRFIVAYEARNATHQWNGAAVINNSTFPFIDNQVKNNRVFSPPPSPPPLPPLPPSPPSPPPSPPPRPPSPPSTVKTGRRSLRQSLQKLLRRQ
ncbi:hypothetical protein HYH02_003485 [Chlamydomonas schloesseri]|uniref:Peptidase S1 domain-containing protein n=1 Tax=Chlamydomonas schloesseri TaxID=2026947 RepID=A0A835WQ95_9CHLO|nr:hypothetical protein HYH02_003485 [Chlamydomonas schloesseri]|eukprot:KAG2451705.1 hypothetical protein HYH02_003485 [Chlamydomonas schloesseri]